MIDVVQLLKTLDKILREEGRKNCMAGVVLAHGHTYMKLLNMAKERIIIPKRIRIPPTMTMTIGQNKAELNHRMAMIVTLEARKKKKPAT